MLQSSRGMNRFRHYVFVASEWLFLAGVAFLIIRNNAYPWPLKRASDIFFLLSATGAVVLLSLTPVLRKQFWNVLSKPIIGVTLFLGSLLAVSFTYDLQGTLNAEGLLAVSRFIEAAVIFLLVGFFQARDSSFFKKALTAQLSTLIYLGALILPSEIHRGRFQWFENWPSNVGYYLIISLAFLTTMLLSSLPRSIPKFLFLYLAVGGLSGILLWTQSRASWLGTAISSAVIGTVWAVSRHLSERKRAKRLLLGGVLALSLLVFGYLLLRPSIKNNVLTRIFPGTALSNESNRYELWRIFQSRFLEQPWGYGANYKPVDIGRGLQGPHNTVLEILISAGLIGLAGVAYIFFLAFRNVAGALNDGSQNSYFALALFSALVGLTIASLFDNMTTFRALWLVLGLSVFFPKSLTSSHSGGAEATYRATTAAGA